MGFNGGLMVVYWWFNGFLQRWLSPQKIGAHPPRGHSPGLQQTWRMDSMDPRNPQATRWIWRHHTFWIVEKRFNGWGSSQKSRSWATKRTSTHVDPTKNRVLQQERLVGFKQWRLSSTKRRQDGNIVKHVPWYPWSSNGWIWMDVIWSSQGESSQFYIIYWACESLWKWMAIWPSPQNSSIFTRSDHGTWRFIVFDVLDRIAIGIQATPQMW